MTDFILHKINKRIELLTLTAEMPALITHYQSRIEYLLTLTLGYLWNKNFNKLSAPDKETLFGEILSPTIGTIVSVCRSLDISAEIFKNSKLNKFFENYPSCRNAILGHGFSFEDRAEENIAKFQELYDNLAGVTASIFGTDNDFIVVQSYAEGIYKGLKYPADGGDVTAWACSENVFNFELDHLYIHNGNNAYLQISPFILIENFGEDLYIYNKVAEKLLGKVHYNRLVKTGCVDKICSAFVNLCIANDGFKIKSSNGTIINIYDDNYEKYIDVGTIKNDVIKFCSNNKANVCATLWGHGGIGKTATIQAVCSHFANKENKTFDYISFLSAKDRRYNYYKGEIEQLSDGITTLNDILLHLNRLIFDENTTDTHPIISLQYKLLLVIDDFESFTKEEASKILDFVTKLDVSYHKVIITTRAASICVGQEIRTNELDVEQTINFLFSIVEEKKIPLSDTDRTRLKSADAKQKIHDLTSGRPLFIHQFVHILMQDGVEQSLKLDIKSTESAVQFLYGKLYDYLSPKAKDLFVIMGLLVNKDDMINVLDKAQYIINMENDDDGFMAAVNELNKLKIIKTVDEDKAYFEVYSKEILEIMNHQFAKRDPLFVKNCNNRFNQTNKDKNADIENSLLINANSNRYVKSEIEVVDSYKQILNRPTSPLHVKLNAIANLTSYLIIDNGKRIDALDCFEKYSHYFTSIKPQSKNRKLYAEYALRWATSNWGNGNEQQKSKAVTILSDYIKSGVQYEYSYDVEVLATLLMYRSILTITDWRDLKDKRQLNEISYPDFINRRKEQVQECKNINNAIGSILYKKVSSTKLTDYPSGTRQSIVNAFYNYIDVLVRLEKREEAIDVCEYVIIYGPANFRAQFNSKKSWLLSLK